ncbi:MAG TPA: hypothetical protein VF179_31665 [Thermoanaerobaculia bacterium]|nr:hypothetical protein [Thermoanaerobaculia bacterium]
MARSLVSKSELDAAGVATLRAAGPAGMEAVLEAITALAEAEPELAKSPVFQTALDAVCAQKDCAASRLFWYTDLEAAKAAAAKSGKPILSLRLLGRLDEELSCANSRFFRTVLYADEHISGQMREDWVLHWQSVRPVPKVTVDFGDGRRLEGTITGNSLHYVLDSKGRIVDAIPGLYAPEIFREALSSGAIMARDLGRSSDKDFVRALADRHLDRYLTLETRIAQFIARDRSNDYSAVADATLSAFVQRAGLRRPTARQASNVSASKSIAEGALLRAVTPEPDRPTVPEDQVVALAARHYYKEHAGLSKSSRKLLIEKFGSWVGTGNVETSIQRFEELIAEDTARNELLFHAAIHARLSEATGMPELDKLTDWIYETLFLTPPADPWMGLAPREVYSVLTPVP